MRTWSVYKGDVQILKLWISGVHRFACFQGVAVLLGYEVALKYKLCLGDGGKSEPDCSAAQETAALNACLFICQEHAGQRRYGQVYTSCMRI